MLVLEEKEEEMYLCRSRKEGGEGGREGRGGGGGGGGEGGGDVLVKTKQKRTCIE